MNRLLPIILLIHACCLFPLTSTLAEKPQQMVDFNRDIRPILVEHCTKCHGPDSSQRKAGLRLDTREGSLVPLESGGLAIVAGNSVQSKLYQRIIAEDPQERMPPADNEKQLSVKQISLIKHWIDQGALWQKHWAYQTPQRPILPPVKNTAWPRNPIDHFILNRLDNAALLPSPMTDKITLLRRTTFNLTGLPPTPQEVKDFLADQSSGAFEKVVDRLLRSPRYAERMTVHWLDLARYADTHGYHSDSHRDMWRWRDWVIEAFGSNMPFDQFTIEQLAGDLLPAASLQQKIATGFNRNNMVNFENGALPEEYHNEYVIDRVVTTSTVWLGQTMRCARCHEHKYDPFTQRDFYQLYAYFNNVPEKGLDGRTGNAVPFIKAPTNRQQALLETYAKEATAIEKSMVRRGQAVAADQAVWEQQFREDAAGSAEPPSDVLVYYRLDESQDAQAKDAGDKKHHGKIKGEPIWIPGKFGNSLLFTGETFIDLEDAAPLERSDSFTCAAWVFPTTNNVMAILARVDQKNENRGFQLLLEGGRVVFALVHAEGKNALRVKSKRSLKISKWQHVLASYDGSSSAEGVTITIDGKIQKIEIIHDNLNESIGSSQPLLIGRRGDGLPLRGMLDEVRIYKRKLTETEAALLAGGDPIREIIEIQPQRRTNEQMKTLRQYYLDHQDPVYKRLKSQLASTREKVEEIDKQVVTTMVMQEMDPPRETYILERGDYRYKTEKVAPGTPAHLLPLPEGAAKNRLGLAQWLVDPKHPLTARVTVNRFWQMFFGVGIVQTADNFGTRGQMPSHPQLLDWLATEFIQSGWDVRHMLKLMVLSSTYRQSSVNRLDLQQRDPQNRLLGRMSRQRLPAEMIRDSALFVSGLLHEKVGGRSVFPYQPAGLWKEVSYNPQEFTAQVYKQDTGNALYRRSMYTFWKRAVPPPALEAFDAPDRETCCVVRLTSNTPMQALVLMNDPTFVEASRTLAEMMMTKAGPTIEDKTKWVFRRIVSRQPTMQEVEILAKIFRKQLIDYRNRPQEAIKLLAVGQSNQTGATQTGAPSEKKFDVSQLAAWTTIVSVMMNLDEAITKN